MNWSLGELPGEGQAIYIDNPGWKTVAIGAATAQLFPQTLSPTSITISSPSNSYNVLLLNYFGFEKPLVVQQLAVNQGAALTALASAVEVRNSSGAFSIGGAFNQGEFSSVSSSSLQIGDVGPGTYNLTNGILRATNVVNLGGNYSARFSQLGGTNSTSLISIGSCAPPYLNASSWGVYALSDGVLATTNTSIGPWGTLNQSGGTHATSSLELNGDQTGPAWADYGQYTLTGGMLLSQRIYLGLGDFLQTGGTNEVAGNLTVNSRGFYNSAFGLAGGLLATSNTTVACTVFGGGGFTQSGGTHIVSNCLTVSRLDSMSSEYTSPYDVDYLFTGGQLIVQNIQIDGGAIFHHFGGALISTGTVILENGMWEANTNTQVLGKLLLASSQDVNSTLSFPNGPSAMQFADSSSIAWSNQAALTIEGWSGSLSGGGLHQVYFGNNSGGLTQQQLNQVQFRNPAGTEGIYPATILSSGEVVPNQILVSRRTGNTLTLSWTPGLALQSSTNASGPFEDVTALSANSFTVTFSEPQRFFRLRSTVKNQTLATFH